MSTATIAHDPVSAPKHYFSENGLEVIDIIEVYGLGDSFHLGNVLKYCLRAKAKGDYVENISKALWYAKRFNEREEDAKMTWPAAMPEADELMPIDSIIREFKLEGPLAEAVADLLNLCVGEEAQPLDQAIENIERAIQEAT
jgi:hypothetical protein